MKKEMPKNIQEVKGIKQEDMLSYINNLEQAEYWRNLVCNPTVIEKATRNGKAVSRKRTFESARKAYFEKFANLEEKKERDIEKQAKDILAMFMEEEQNNNGNGNGNN